MYYAPVNDISTPVSLEKAIRDGVTREGKLFLPQAFPRLPEAFFSNISSMSLQEIAYVVLNMLFGEDIPAEKLRDIARHALRDIEIPLIRRADNEFELDLTKGPTGSYHDISARVLAEFIRYRNPERNINVLVITNGNAANAVADALRDIPQATVYALYPRNSFSPERRSALLARENVVPVEVDGSYADCRRIALETLTNKEVRDNTVTLTANSENIAILLPRIIYFFYAYARLAKMELPLDNVVLEFETSHLGNLTAAVIAEKMGLPKCRLYPILSNSDTAIGFTLPRMIQLMGNNITEDELKASAALPPQPSETLLRLITQAPQPSVAVPREKKKKILHIGTAAPALVRTILNAPR